MKLLALFGPKRGGVKVVETRRGGERVVLVRWRVHGARQQRSFPATPAGRIEAKAFARGVVDSRAAPLRPEAPLVRGLWQLYATAEFPALRPRTQRNYAARWRLFEVFIGHDRRADTVTLQHLDEFRAALRAQKTRRKQFFAPNQVKHIVRLVKIVFRWGRQRKLLVSDVPEYRFKMAKAERAAEPPEYSPAEFEAILRQLNPSVHTQWRAWALWMFIGHQGVRENAALCLRWTDIVGDEVHWPAETDKVGRAWVQPLRWGAWAALETARWWREKTGYTGPWVFPTGRPGRAGDAPYTAQALAHMVWEAEKDAGVDHHDLRGMHGLRRMVAGNIYALTGSEKAALDFIGDRDPRLIPKYLRERPGALAELAARLDADEARNVAVSTETSNETATAATSETVTAAKAR